MKKITIENNVTGKKFAAVMNNQAEIDAWKQKHLSKGTWGNSDDLEIEEINYTRPKSAKEIAREALEGIDASKLTTASSCKSAIEKILNYLDIDYIGKK